MRIIEVVKKIYHLKYKEFKLFRKQNDSDEVIYIIRFFPKEGLMSMLYRTLSQIEYAVSKGWTPYIDTQHFSNMYQVRGVNSWEYFFSQPIVIGKNKKTKKYVIGSQVQKGTNLFKDYWAVSFDHYREKLMFLTKYIRILPEMEEKVDGYCRELELDKCIGVYCRGTDYVSLKPKGHPAQPSIDEVIEKISEFLERENSNIFLVTEDAKIKETLSQKFGERIITIKEDKVFANYKKGKMLVDSIESQNKIDVASTYMVKILCLARCKRLIVSKTNGSLMALIFRGNDNETFVFDKGFY